MAALMVGAFCMASVMVSATTVVQALVADHFRGRVLSLHTMVSLGLMPFGSLAISALVKYFGPELGLTINGLLCLAAAAIFAWRLPDLRRAARSSPEYPHPQHDTRANQQPAQPG
jgi:MFS family permease